jgi:thiamine-phosphate pyrophosphorylase
MTPDLYLVAPDDADAAGFPALLQRALAAAPAGALLMPMGDRTEADYRALVAAVLPVAQKAGCAVLLDNRPDLVKPLNADGVHVTGGAKAVSEAVALLKPDFIVGAGEIGSRHEAMVRGELDIDYLLFGDREDGAEMARWWSETFEIPAVYKAASMDDPELKAMPTEFVAFGDIWDNPEALRAQTSGEAG